MPSTIPVALVTGAARRIGAEIARHLHKAGMSVILHYNASENEALNLAEQLNQLRADSAVAIQADLRDPKSAEDLVKQAANHWQRLDVLVNNASRFYKTEIGKATEAAWDDLMTSNLKMPFFLAQAAAPYIAAQQGSIINITDIHAERALRDYAIYCMAKSGLLMMTKLLAKELGPLIRVNAVAPGSVMWPEGENVLSDEEKRKIVDRTSLARAGSPADIAKTVLFLVRDAEYVTGQVINVDGGRG